MIDPNTYSLIQSMERLKEDLESMTLEEFESVLTTLSPAESRWITALLNGEEEPDEDADLNDFLLETE